MILSEGEIIAHDSPEALFAQLGEGSGGEALSLEEVFLRLVARSKEQKSARQAEEADGF